MRADESHVGPLSPAERDALDRPRVADGGAPFLFSVDDLLSSSRQAVEETREQIASTRRSIEQTREAIARVRERLQQAHQSRVGHHPASEPDGRNEGEEPR